jgi:hypothetical protein
MLHFQASSVVSLLAYCTLILCGTHCTAQPPRIFDVALGRGGTLQGEVIDIHGVQQPGREVSLWRNGQRIATTKTNEAGQFALGNLSGGVYIAEAGSSACAFRAWAWRTAPPAAETGFSITLATKEELKAVRGQDCCWRVEAFFAKNPLLGYSIIAAAIAVPVAVIAHNQDDAS